MSEENKIYLKENFNIDVDKLTIDELRKKLNLIIENKSKVIELQKAKINLLKQNV